MQPRTKASAFLPAFILSIAISLFFGSTAALAADGPLEVTSFHMLDGAGSGEAGVTYFYQIENNGDVPVSEIRINDSICSAVSYDGINQDANVNAMLEKGEVWSYHCKTAAANHAPSTVTVSGVVEGDTVNADTTSTLRTISGAAGSGEVGATGTDGAADGVNSGAGADGGINFDAIPNGMPNTGKGGASAIKTGSNESASTKAKSIKKPAVKPATLVIPAASADAPIEKVGRTEQGAMAVPADDGNAGLYAFGPNPGEKGNAVIAGHLDTYSGLNGVFSGLNKLKTGDDVYVNWADGESTRFKVTSTATYKSADAPLNDIFGSSDKARLNLITCAGKWDGKARQYTHRLVVFTELVE